MQPVKSSNILAVGYDPLSRELHVQFKTGRYAFENVPPEAAEKLSAASSVGSHFHQNIKGRFSARKLKPEEYPPIA